MSFKVLGMYNLLKVGCMRKTKPWQLRLKTTQRSLINLFETGYKKFSFQIEDENFSEEAKSKIIRNSIALGLNVMEQYFDTVQIHNDEGEIETK